MVWSGPRGWGLYFIGTNGDISWKTFQQNIQKTFTDPNIINDLSEYDDSCVTPQQLNHLLLWNKDEVEKVGRDGVLVTDNFPYTEFPLWRYLRKKGRAVWMPQEVFGIKQAISATDR